MEEEKTQSINKTINLENVGLPVPNQDVEWLKKELTKYFTKTGDEL